MGAEQKLVFPRGEMLAKPHEHLCEAVEVKARPLPLGGYLQPWLWQVLGEGRSSFPGEGSLVCGHAAGWRSSGSPSFSSVTPHCPMCVLATAAAASEVTLGLWLFPA